MEGIAFAMNSLALKDLSESLKTDYRPETIESHIVHLLPLDPYITISGQ